MPVPTKIEILRTEFTCIVKRAVELGNNPRDFSLTVGEAADAMLDCWHAETTKSWIFKWYCPPPLPGDSAEIRRARVCIAIAYSLVTEQEDALDEREEFSPARHSLIFA